MKVLGLEFYQGKAGGALAAARGLCVFPSAPGLATLDRDERYREALLKADTRFVDSGFLALFWFFLSFERLSRISGLRFLKMFLADPDLRRKRILWIHPTPQKKRRNQHYLELEQKLPPQLSTHYLAPIYPAAGPISDPSLLALIKEKQPQIIVICLGSGIQEPLGAWLKGNLSYYPTILCTGGAIDFLTGAQASIPAWADRLFLGWLLRILTTPVGQHKEMRTSPAWRYVGAWRLLWLIIKWRRQLPE